MRINNLQAIVSEIKQGDGSTAVTHGMLRELVKQDKINHFYRGNRLVSDMDKLVEEINKIFGIEDKNTMPRIRSINDAFLELRESKPGLGISEAGIRFLVKEKNIPSIEVRSRSFVALECFDEPYSNRFIDINYCDKKKALIDKIVQEQLAKGIESFNNRQGGK